MRWLLIAIVVLICGCSDDSGLGLGQPCNAHEECASGLCSIPIPDGGLDDAGTTPAKRCMEPSL